MKKKRIAVISKRQRVLDFFRLEAESCYCTVTVGNRIPSDTSEYDLLIIDDDGSYVMTDVPSETYRIISEDKELTQKSFYWPVSVARVREIFEGVVCEPENKSHGESNFTLYLLDGKERAVVYKNQKIDLTDSEQMVLYRLIEADGTPVSREELLSLFDTSDGNIADVYICHLRRKLEAPFGMKIIRTVRGKGYALSVKTVKYSN